MVNLYISAEPSIEPITLTDAKLHLRVDTSDDDAYITALITAARQWVEQVGNLCIIQQTVVEKFDSFPIYGYFNLTKAPVISVDSIQYTDTNGDTQTWAATEYDTDITSKPARIMPKFGKTYPFTRVTLAPVSITYKAGFGAAASSVPVPILQAMKLLIGEMYENRQVLTNAANTPKQGAVEKLLNNYRVTTF
jgi:uncharacterized phiE125 gp8 family phage protein